MGGLRCPAKRRNDLVRLLHPGPTPCPPPDHSLITNALLPKKRPMEVGVLPKKQISEYFMTNERLGAPISNERWAYDHATRMVEGLVRQPRWYFSLILCLPQPFLGLDALSPCLIHPRQEATNGLGIARASTWGIERMQLLTDRFRPRQPPTALRAWGALALGLGTTCWGI